VPAAFLVPHQDVLDLRLPHRVVQRQDRGPGDAEDEVDALTLHHAHCGFGGGHLGHAGLLIRSGL
jgi:hypothetical protein